ncbi:MAG TPA: LLM class flavin-dependent oxidoreductase [Dehalococcoidia bacterium]|jgi:alkanesulfonate monooxygenase SsuD/methylene tetrahydromethanopterin reductase-like flavin-dependent oxidoreductase (luciferase family)
MKVCFLGPGAYAGRVERGGWPVPPELCDRETAATSYKIQLDQFELADELGFDWISMSEHHYAPGLMTPNPIVLAGAASQRTKRVKIALLGPLIPLTNPVRVAEELSMLDSINGGRTVVLFLRGTPNEHLTYTVDGKASPYTREITQEGVRLILKAWQEPRPFSWRGQFFNFEHVSVWPRALQEPHMPVFYSGNSMESIEFAAANHLNLAIGFAPVSRVAEHVAAYKRLAGEAGWTPTNENVLYRARALVAEDDEQAMAVVQRNPAMRAAAPATSAAHYGPSATAEAPRPPAGEGGGAPGVAGFQFYGSPKTVVEQARAYRDAGVGILDIAFAGEAFGRGGTRKAMEAFASVLPDVQAL